jgi:hypothetical protein
MYRSQTAFRSVRLANASRAGYGGRVSRRRVLLGVAIAAVAVGAALVHRLVTPVPS